MANEVVRQAVKYFDQHYRFSSYFWDESANSVDNTMFCSRLVAHAFRTAGIALTTLPDNKVLPVDLYQICQSERWEEITSQLIVGPISEKANSIFPLIQVAGEKPKTMSEFFAATDDLMIQGARLAAEVERMRHRSAREMLDSEILMAEFCSLHLANAKAMLACPDQLDDATADSICRVLKQFPALLDLAHLPNLDLLIDESPFNSPNDVESSYVNFPAPIAIRQMQEQREQVRIYTFLLLAKLGLLAVLAHHTASEKFAQFRLVTTDRVQRFLHYIEFVDDLSVFENEENLFLWIDQDGDREIIRDIFRDIIAALKALDQLRKADFPNS